MQFVLVLSVIMVAILALLSALAVIMGTRKRQKNIALGYCLFALVVAFWSGFVAILYMYGVNNGWLLVGPAIAGLGMVGLYYAVLRNRIILIDAKWLRFLTYVVIMSVVAIIYVFIFYFIFTYIFKFQEIQGSILVLNYIMILIVLLLFPIVNEVTNFADSLIRQGQVNLDYVIRRLNKMATENIDLDELSIFLARSLHFGYLGLVVNGKLYGSKVVMVSKEKLKPLTNLGKPEYGIWQELKGSTKILCDSMGVKAIAELRDAKGKSFGQILVGRPLGKVGFERKDLIQLEMIINLVAAMIDTRAKGVKR